MGEDQVIELLRQAIADAGSQKAFAQASNLSPQYICDVLHGRRGLSDTVLRVLGVERHYTLSPPQPRRGNDKGGR